MGNQKSLSSVEPRTGGNEANARLQASPEKHGCRASAVLSVAGTPITAGDPGYRMPTGSAHRFLGVKTPLVLLAPSKPFFRPRPGSGLGPTFGLYRGSVYTRSSIIFLIRLH